MKYLPELRLECITSEISGECITHNIKIMSMVGIKTEFEGIYYTIKAGKNSNNAQAPLGARSL